MRRALAIALCLLLCTGIRAQRQIVQNFKGQFIGRSFTVEGIPSKHVNALCTDGDYLYAGAGDQIYSIDISNPLQPKVLSSTRVYGLIRQMVVQEGTLFASARESGCWIVDVSDPLHISLITRYETVELATGIEVAGNVLFLGTRQNGVECVDISDVRHPIHIRMEKTGESQSVCYKDGILYSGEWGPHSVTVIDAHDMSALKTLGTVNLQGFGDGVWISGKYLYVSTGHHLVAPGLSEQERHGNGHGVEIFDITDPRNPVFVSRVAFDKAFSHYNDYWTPRPCSDGKYVICADTVNGLYVADSSNPRQPELISRVHFLTEDGQDIAVNSVAIAKGVVFAALWNSYGLVGFVCPEAYPEIREKGLEPANPQYRFHYQTNAGSHFRAWKPDGGAPVRGVAAKDDLLFAACSFGGLAVFRRSCRGKLVKVGHGPMPYAEDVKVRGNRLYVAEGADGLAVYEIGKKGSLKELARYKDFAKDGPNAWCLWVYVPSEKWVVASTRYGGNYYISMENFPTLRFEAYIGDGPGWDKFAANEADSRGMYPTTLYTRGVYWVNLNEQPLHDVMDNSLRLSLYDGVCRYSDDRFITVSKGKMYIYSAKDILKPKEGIVLGDEDFRGIPAWDGGHQLSLTCRIRREIRKVDITEERSPRLLWTEKTTGYPETSIFWKGKLAVPCGYQGLLIEK